MAFCYILRCADGSFYVGSTEHLERRVAAHQDGTGSVHTAARRPVTLAYAEEHDTIEAARARKRQIKRWSRAKKTALVNRDGRLLKHHSQSSRTKQQTGAVVALSEDHPISRLVGTGRGGGRPPGAHNKHAILDQ